MPAMTASQQIDKQIAELSDWRGAMMTRLRALIGASSPDLHEDWKWGTAVWAGKKNVVALGAFKDHLKLNFFRGASIDDPKRLFNSGLDAKDSRSIDLREGDRINEASLKALIRAAVAEQKA